MKQEDIDIYELCLLADYFSVSTDFILGRTSDSGNLKITNLDRLIFTKNGEFTI